MSFYSSYTPGRPTSSRRDRDSTANYRDVDTRSVHPPKGSMLFTQTDVLSSPILLPPPISQPSSPYIRRAGPESLFYRSPEPRSSRSPETAVQRRSMSPLNMPLPPSLPAMMQRLHVAPTFREPVPKGYSLDERDRVCFTSRNQPGILVSDCIRTNYNNVDNGHIVVKCFEPYVRIPWALMWPGYNAGEVQEIELRGDARTYPHHKKWALGSIGGANIRLDQIWLVAFGMSDAEHHLWIPEFEVTTTNLPYT
ncbi:hypothetical protein EIP91_001393 [Steccherinum ochraceum]|uniref:Uncharacterized protein n=1 Tax=Steccherinum ochraceum TaxID=92696 RepID=A0A4R0RGP7_9APHY|nr:hypothetical protein EIP91_001393 [Steccherinum ochraceum]